MLAVAASAGELPPPAARTIDFAREVQPILERRCLACHGAKVQRSGYRLEKRDSALRGGETGEAAIVPGKSDSSPLVLRVAGLGSEKPMPPRGERLSAEEIGVLRAWIDQGASWPEAVVLSDRAAQKKHWAFVPPERPDPPEVTRAEGIRNEIDRFVLARLAKEGLEPSPEADRATLLRRLSLDLIGLPPEPAEVDSFLADPSPDACEKQVERLLASPHHGEKWARHWLDAARYADSNGYEKDRAREMWHYRDWVVDALNRDMPYDRFLIEQIAGDLLPDSTQDQLIATGFLRNSMINEEGAIDQEQFRIDSMFDRMDCIGKSILGLTVQCAQCHDHKFDPLTQKEYYRMFSFLNDVDEYTAPLYSPEGLQKIAEVRRRTGEIEEELRRSSPEWRERQARWEEEAGRGQVEWTVLVPYDHGDAGGLSKLRLEKDRVLLAGGHPFGGGTWRIKARTRLTGITAVRLEAFTNSNLPMRGPGRSPNGLFGLKEIRLEIAPASTPEKKPDPVAFARATADFEEPERSNGAPPEDQNHRRYGPVRFAIDGDEKTIWTVDAGPGRRNTDRKAVFNAKEPFGFAEGTELTFYLAVDDELSCFRLSLTTSKDAAADPLPRRVREALAIPRDRRTPAESGAIFGSFRLSVPEFAEGNRKIDEVWKGFPEATGSALVLAARADPRQSHVLMRGDWLKPADPVLPGVPSFLHPIGGGADPTRLDLARWLADRRSPTTARVFVNRIWQALFGEGIVASPEDFGTQGAPPSHPEMLDWLASEFMEPRRRLPGEAGDPAPWSMKHILRLITGSATYRQSSRLTPEALEKDLRNRLLARGPRMRVEGEVVRDIALSASGLLNPQLGGPPVFAPAPEFLFKPPTSYQVFPWKDETGPQRYRRGFYTFRRRSTPYPAFQIFDAPSGEFSCARRQRSNTPLQALTTLNETVFVESAQALARKTLAEGGASDDGRISFAFRRVVGRAPTDRERGRLAELLQKQKQRIADGWLNSFELATGKNELPAALPTGTTPADLAAYTVVARVLLNLDETITKE